jgi:hypothetical protein
MQPVSAGILNRRRLGTEAEEIRRQQAGRDEERVRHESVVANLAYASQA